MFIELCKISKLVIHLNSHSMDLGCDSVGVKALGYDSVDN